MLIFVLSNKAVLGFDALLSARVWEKMWLDKNGVCWDSVYALFCSLTTNIVKEFSIWCFLLENCTLASQGGKAFSSYICWIKGFFISSPLMYFRLGKCTLTAAAPKKYHPSPTLWGLGVCSSNTLLNEAQFCITVLPDLQYYTTAAAAFAATNNLKCTRIGRNNAPDSSHSKAFML